MLKRKMTAVLLGLAVASQAVLAQDMTSPAHPDPRRAASQQPLTYEQERLEQRQLDEYWATHNDDAPSYPFTP
jgi:hypothetical protein